MGPALNETHSKVISLQFDYGRYQQMLPFQGFNNPNENIPRPMNTTQQIPVWTQHLANSYQSPRPGRGKFHSYLPTQHQRYSSILVWWHWGPARCHKDWRHLDYSSTLSFLLWVDLLLSLKRVEKVNKSVDRIHQIYLYHHGTENTVVKTTDRTCQGHFTTESCFPPCVGCFHFKIKMHLNPEFRWISNPPQESKSVKIISFYLNQLLYSCKFGCEYSFHICFLDKHRVILYWARTPA